MFVMLVALTFKMLWPNHFEVTSGNGDIFTVLGSECCLQQGRNCVTFVKCISFRQRYILVYRMGRSNLVQLLIKSTFYHS